MSMEEDHLALTLLRPGEGQSDPRLHVSLQSILATIRTVSKHLDFSNYSFPDILTQKLIFWRNGVTSRHHAMKYRNL